MGGASHKPRVVETYRDGATLYDVRRLSWEEYGVEPCEVVLRSFLTRWQADEWVRETLDRQHELHDVATENFRGHFPHSLVDTEA